ncbi:hypothetical protein GEMRC1_001365 [Eukaryota sp. GEM-RC1]
MHLTVTEVTSLKDFTQSFSLQGLSLRGCRLTKEGMTVLCDLLRVNRSLTLFDLVKCSLSDDDIKKIIDSLQTNQCSKVSKMNFSNNSISNEGVTALAEYIKDHSNMEVVMSNNCVNAKTKELIKEISANRICC